MKFKRSTLALAIARVLYVMNPIPLIIGATVIVALWRKRMESGAEAGSVVSALLILAMASL